LIFELFNTGVFECVSKIILFHFYIPVTKLIAALFVLDYYH